MADLYFQVALDSLQKNHAESLTDGHCSEFSARQSVLALALRLMAGVKRQIPDCLTDWVGGDPVSPVVPQEVSKPIDHQDAPDGFRPGGHRVLCGHCLGRCQRFALLEPLGHHVPEFGLDRTEVGGQPFGLHVHAAQLGLGPDQPLLKVAGAVEVDGQGPIEEVGRQLPLVGVESALSEKSDVRLRGSTAGG